MEDIMLIRSSFLRRIISQVINKILKSSCPAQRCNWARFRRTGAKKSRS